MLRLPTTREATAIIFISVVLLLEKMMGIEFILSEKDGITIASGIDDEGVAIVISTCGTEILCQYDLSECVAGLREHLRQLEDNYPPPIYRDDLTHLDYEEVIKRAKQYAQNVISFRKIPQP